MGSMLNIKKPYVYRIVVLWALVLSLILLYQGVGGNIISIDYFPVFPRIGEPVQIIVRLSNPDPEPKLLDVRVYVDGLVVANWLTHVDGLSIREYRVVEPSRFSVGESIRVHVDAVNIGSGTVYSRSAMVPPFPPEVFSSFTSFASFSSTLMGLYDYTIILHDDGSRHYASWEVNAGLILSLTLIGLLVFLELTDPAYGNIGERLTHLRRNYTREAIILLIVFLAMVATKVIFIIYGV